MSRINLGKNEKIDLQSQEWIKENHPENGLFKVYWKDVISPYSGGASFKDEGEGLRYEWYYKNGKRADGVSKAWFPKKYSYRTEKGSNKIKLDDQLKRIQYWKDGKLNGLYTQWYENGQKSREKTYKDGKIDGKGTRWYKNGNKREEVKFKDGNGLFTGWYDNGQKWYEETYKNGKRDGLWTYWNENEQKERERNYKDDKKDGLWIFWDRDGKKRKEQIYKEGEKISVQEY